MTNKPFIPFEHQSFAHFQSWVNYASSRLTSHPKYSRDLFRASCFDQKFRYLNSGADFQRAEFEDAFPVFWVWPDQWAQVFEQITKLQSKLKPNDGWQAEDCEFGFSSIDDATDGTGPNEIVELQQGIILDNNDNIFVVRANSEVNVFNTETAAETFIKSLNESEGD